MTMHRFVLPRSEHLRVALEKVENVSRKGGPLDKIVRECTEHYDLRVSPLFLSTETSRASRLSFNLSGWCGFAAVEDKV
jgi:hypothetical protein